MEEDSIIRTIRFRGEYIDSMVEVEGQIEEALLAFFGAAENRNVYIVLHHHLFHQPAFSTAMKVGLITNIAKAVLRGQYDNLAKPYFELIDRFIRVRNIVAHYLAHEDGYISYVKPSTKFKHVPNPETNIVEDSPSLQGDYFLIEIKNSDVHNEILIQFSMIFQFMGFLTDTLSKEEFRMYSTPSQRFWSLEGMPDYLTKGGIWDVKMPPK